jgi:hypothetical protein
VALHAEQHVVEQVERLGDVRPLVQHHALGPLGQDDVRHLGARRQALRHQLFENLGGPDDRHAGRLAQPQQLFLDVGQAPEAELDCQVAAREHHRRRGAAGRAHDDVGQVAHRALGLDLQREGGPAPTHGAALVDRVEQQADVVR